ATDHDLADTPITLVGKVPGSNTGAVQITADLAGAPRTLHHTAQIAASLGGGAVNAHGIDAQQFQARPSRRISVTANNAPEVAFDHDLLKVIPRATDSPNVDQAIAVRRFPDDGLNARALEGVVRQREQLELMAGCIKRRASGSVQVPDGGNDFDGVSIDIREGKDGSWSDAVFQGLDGLGIHTENKSWLPIRSESGFLVRQ